MGFPPLTCIVRQDALLAVKGEPALFPGLDPAAHLDQVTFAGLAAYPHLRAGIHTVPRRLQVFTQVKRSRFRLPDLHRVGSLQGSGTQQSLNSGEVVQDLPSIILSSLGAPAVLRCYPPFGIPAWAERGQRRCTLLYDGFHCFTQRYLAHLPVYGVARRS